MGARNICGEAQGLDGRPRTPLLLQKFRWPGDIRFQDIKLSADKSIVTIGISCPQKAPVR